MPIAIGGYKVCPKCKKKKSLSEFYRNRSQKDGYCGHCKVCEIAYKQANKERINATKKKWADRQPGGLKEYRKRWRLKTYYNLTLEDYNKMFEKQQGCCDICGKHQGELKYPLCVDHQHSNGKIRALLCHSCNLILGRIETIDLKIFLDYLEKHNG